MDRAMLTANCRYTLINRRTAAKTIESEKNQEEDEEDLCLWLCHLSYKVYLQQCLTGN